MFKKNPLQLFKNGYPTMWASMYETMFTFFVYDELKDFTRYFVTEMGYWDGALKFFNGFVATSVGLSIAIMHDKYLRNLVERPVDKVAKDMF